MAPDAGLASPNISDTGASRVPAMRESMEALTRLAPRSYFWICWKVTPADSANACCDRPRSLRSRRMRAPTATSIGSASASGLRVIVESCAERMATSVSGSAHDAVSGVPIRDPYEGLRKSRAKRRAQRLNGRKLPGHCAEFVLIVAQDPDQILRHG